MKESEKLTQEQFKILDTQRSRHLYKLFTVILGIWFLAIFTSLLSNVDHEKKESISMAKNDALSLFKKDQALRHWATKLGGVYIPVTELTPPNPYLKVPNRDITLPSGQLYTLMNPAYMLRQVMHDYEDAHGIKEHITSLKPLNPGNAPDPWEEEALKSFEKGSKEVVAVTEQDGKKFLRFMQPMVVAQGCLKCHAHQGYKEGDIRGGVSVSVPLAPYFQREKDNISILIFTHIMVFFSGMVFFILSLRRTHKAELELEKMFLLTSDILCTAEIGGSFKKINPAAEKILGYTQKELLSKPYLDFVHPEDVEKTKQIGVEKLGQGVSVFDFENRYCCKDGSYRWLAWTANPVPERGMLYAVGRDITERKIIDEQIRLSLREKETLLKEIHHRVKNNLNIISSLLSLQAKKNNDPLLKAHLDDSRNRISTMALVHEKLYKTKNFSQINFHDFIKSLVKDLSTIYSRKEKNIQTTLEIDAIELDLETGIPLGLIANELLTNCYKYAFTNKSSGHITIEFFKKLDSFSFAVKDDGVGFAKDFDLHNTNTLGLELVRVITKQLNGSLEINSDQGVKVTISFQESKQKQKSEG